MGKTNQPKPCFVISPLGDPDSETRKRSNQVLRHVVRPAVESCGYEALRADEIDKPGMITSQVIQHVVDDPLVVADLTERNPNVFYELAIRHALRKPLVQLIRKGEAIPFDVADTRTIYLDHKDLDSVDAAKEDIVKQVKALESESLDIETPISVSLDLQLLRQSKKPEERSLADLVETVGDLRASLGNIEARLGTEDQKGLLDQIQTELRRLPARIDEYPDAPRRRAGRLGRFHSMMARELLHMAPRSTPAFGVLIIASYFRDSMPWLYEMGLEVYRAARRGRGNELEKAASEFRQAVELGAALLRRRPNQSLRQRGRRQLDPSRRGEGAAEGTGGRWYLCRQRRLGVFRWYSRAWWRVSVRINAPAARGGLRTVATAAKCHRAPVDSHPVAGRMPTGLQGAGDEHRTPHRRCHVDNVEYHCGFQGVRGGAREAVAMVTRRRISTKERSGSRFSAASSGCRPS